LSLATNFKSGMEQFVASNKPVYGECGGFMVLGEVLTDANGTAHEMLGMLPVSTSFSAPKRHLGYRQATLIQDCVLGLSGTQFRGHEFHYAELTTHQASNPLFDISNARGDAIGLVGAVAGNVAGSFIHLIDKA
jgi:cobyrinic acid a,c-diamide synthase